MPDSYKYSNQIWCFYICFTYLFNTDMAIFKNEDQREIEVLDRLEKQLVKREKRERLLHILVAGLSLFSVAAFIAGHCYSKRK